MKLRIAGWREELDAALAASKFEDALGVVAARQQQIEQDTPKQGLSPWFDVRGVTGVLLDILARAGDQAESLCTTLLTQHQQMRAGSVAVAQWRVQQGEPTKAIPLFESALAARVDDLFVQELLADAHLLASGGTSRGGQAPPEHWQGRYCYVPFQHFEPIDNGTVFTCCPTHVPFGIGNIYQQPVEQIWNSPSIQAIRASILDGSYRYCSKMHCDRLLGGTLPRVEDVKHLPTTTVVPRLPREVVLNHDRSCNLTCPSCRTKTIMADGAEREKLDRVRPEIVRIVNAADRVIITNAGDPFASKHYRSLLQEIRPAHAGKSADNQWLRLYTHAQLFTPQEWDKLQHLHDCAITVDISIDAATADTYHVLRRGGSFEKLVTNLEFISGLRKEKRIKRLCINMTVQKRNLYEMVDFAKWGLSLGCDSIYFLRVRNWGTFATEEFLDLDVCAPTHPLFDDYSTIVRNEVFANRRVSLGTLPRPAAAVPAA